MMRRLVRAAIRNATVTRSEGVTLKIDPLILTAANILLEWGQSRKFNLTTPTAPVKLNFRL